jgi:hypothetical protein
MTTTVWTCDGCCKPVEGGRRYCSECLKAIAERSAPRDCKFCGGPIGAKLGS